MKRRCRESIIKGVSCILVDEAQFLGEEGDRGAAENYIASMTFPMLCYGLRTDFKSHLFEGRGAAHGTGRFDRRGEGDVPFL